MKMYKRYLFFLVTVLVISSCNHKTVFTEVTINNRYSISVPDYLQPCKDLHKDASMQYQNAEKGIYALVIDEKKKTMQDYDINYDIDAYFNNIAKQGFIESIKNGKISVPGRQEINGNKALIAEVTGKVEQTDVYYKLAIIETPYTFYQILSWTSAENKEKFEPDMVKMIESLKEMPLPPSELPAKKTLNDSVKITLKY